MTSLSASREVCLNYISTAIVIIALSAVFVGRAGATGDLPSISGCRLSAIGLQGTLEQKQIRQPIDAMFDVRNAQEKEIFRELVPLSVGSTYLGLAVRPIDAARKLPLAASVTCALVPKPEADEALCPMPAAIDSGVRARVIQTEFVDQSAHVRIEVEHLLYGALTIGRFDHDSLLASVDGGRPKAFQLNGLDPQVVDVSLDVPKSSRNIAFSVASQGDEIVGSICF